jgi:hypothetical protein
MPKIVYQPMVFTNKKLTKKEYDDLIKKYKNHFGSERSRSVTPTPMRNKNTRRDRSPETQKRREIKTWFIFGGEDDEDEKIEEILANPESGHFDLVSYESSNQLGRRQARILVDARGNKKLSDWMYYNTDDY